MSNSSPLIALEQLGHLDSLEKLFSSVIIGLPVIGALGALLLAKRKGLLSAIKPEMEALVNFGFRISQNLFDRVLNDAGEK